MKRLSALAALFAAVCLQAQTITPEQLDQLKGSFDLILMAVHAA